MKRQLKGIALLLAGIQLTLIWMIDPWIPLLGDPGRVAIAVLAIVCGIAGLAVALKSGGEDG